MRDFDVKKNKLKKYCILRKLCLVDQFGVMLC